MTLRLGAMQDCAIRLYRYAASGRIREADAFRASIPKLARALRCGDHSIAAVLRLYTEHAGGAVA